MIGIIGAMDTEVEELKNIWPCYNDDLRREARYV